MDRSHAPNRDACTVTVRYEYMYRATPNIYIPIPHTVSSCSTTFSPRLWEPWTQITPPPSETPCKPLPPETWTTPQPYHTKEKSVWNFFVQFKVCYTQVSGPVQTTCSNTLSSMRTRHFSRTAVCTQSHKRLSNICMFTCSCTTNHLVLFPSQLLDSQCFSLHMYSIYVKHSYSLYSLYFFILYLLFLVCIG